MSLALLLALLPAQADAFAPPPDYQDCWVQPLQVSLPELAMMGEISERVVRDHCSRWVRPNSLSFPRRGFVAAETRFADFHLFGERLSLGFDVVVQPGALGSPDSAFAVVALDLPESWERVIDQATYPALAIGGTAILTAVVVKLLAGKP